MMDICIKMKFKKKSKYPSLILMVFDTDKNLTFLKNQLYLAIYFAIIGSKKV